MAINSCYEIVPHEKYINLDKKEPFYDINYFISRKYKNSATIFTLDRMRPGLNAPGVKCAWGQMRALAGLGSNMGSLVMLMRRDASLRVYVL